MSACYLRNLCPSASINFKAPIEIWKGREFQELDFKYRRVFGCRAWMWKPVVEGKLYPRGEEVVMVGYEPGVKGYRLWNIKDRKIYMSRDVKFRETCFPFRAVVEPGESNPDDNVMTIRNPGFVYTGPANQRGPAQSRSPVPEETAGPVAAMEAAYPEVANLEAADNPVQDGDSAHGMEATPVAAVPALGPEVEPEQTPEADQGPATEGLEPTPRRSERIPKPKTCPCCLRVHAVKDGEMVPPETAREALSCPQAVQWREAMKEEVENLCSQGTWEIVLRPKMLNVVGSKWVFALKRDDRGNIVKYKARLVAQGFRQIYGLYYLETFSPVIHRKSIRMLLGIAIENEWEIDQLDVVGAYLNCTLEENVFMEIPLYLGEVEYDRKKFVCKLIKSIYGLKQSGRNWINFLHDILLKSGFQQCVSDKCIYYLPELIVGVYVDDMLIIGMKELVQKFKSNLADQIKIKDLGQANNILSIRIRRPERDLLYIDQEVYVKDILEEFEMQDCNGAGCPLAVDAFKSERDEESSVSQYLYCKAVGCLLYLSGCTRPDIAHAVCILSQFSKSPCSTDWANIKHIFRYLQKTKYYALCFKKTNSVITASSDSDWAGDLSNGKSVSGFHVNLAGAAFSWRARKQQCVKTSSTHAEYVALCECTAEVKWVVDLMNELNQQRFVPLHVLFFVIIKVPFQLML